MCLAVQGKLCLCDGQTLGGEAPRSEFTPSNSPISHEHCPFQNHGSVCFGAAVSFPGLEQTKSRRRSVSIRLFLKGGA